MPSTTVSIGFKGVDRASGVIQQISKRLNGMAGPGGGSGLGKLVSGGVKMATQSLKQMGGALSQLGPAGMAAGIVVAAAMKRMAFEAEQNVKAIQDQLQALKGMDEYASRVTAHMEQRLKLAQQLRVIQDEIDGADAVAKARTGLANVDAEIETVRKEIEELDAVRRTALKQAGQFTAGVEDVRAGHLVWWETGTEKANAENLKSAEESRKTAMQASEKLLQLQQRLTLLTKEREKAEKGISDAVTKQTEETRKEIEKTQEQARRDQVKALQAEQKTLAGQLAALKQMSAAARMSGLFSAGSHQATLLLDRLSGRGNDATSLEISKNVRCITDRLADIDRRLEALQTV